MSGRNKLTRIMEQLEDRVLFDAVPDGGFLLQAPEPAPPSLLEPAQESTVETHSEDTQPRELVFIDGSVEDPDQLLSEVLAQREGRTLEVRMLDAESDGIDEITSVLESSGQIYDAIHILSHGEDGEVRLGNAVLDNQSLRSYSTQFLTWADHLTEEADLMLYGCNLAASADGERFVEAIGTFTGADVAASSDFTGASQRGGDWELEFSVGAIETQALTFRQWFGLLADFTAAPLVGVDIGPSSDVTSPTNWTKANGVGTYTNLVDETGTNSGYSLSIATTGSLNGVNSDPSSATVPNHTNDLSGLDGSFYDNSGGVEQITLTWSG